MSHATHPGCRWFEEVWNKRNPDAIKALTSSDLRAHGADGVLRGQTEFLDFYNLFVNTVPDIRVDVVNCVRAGDYVAVQWEARGNHSADQAGWPATGRPIQVPGLSLMRLSGDTIVEAWDSFDIGGLMKTMNAPAPV